jgi:hypothetical protein
MYLTRPDIMVNLFCRFKLSLVWLQ